MTRFIMPVVLIVIAIALFFLFANPLYNDIAAMRADIASYNDALGNSKALENERDKLTTKYNSINPDDLTRLERMLPDNVDNVRLILEIEQLATPYNMVLKDIKYNAQTSATTGTPQSQTGQIGLARTSAPSHDYGIFDLEFTTSGTYDNFLKFTRDLESNLRIVDVSSITFSSDRAASGITPKANSADTYAYDFKIQTYWLKN